MTDVTEFALFSKKVYLSSILDLFNEEIISYNISLSPNFYQVNDMLDKTFSRFQSQKELSCIQTKDGNIEWNITSIALRKKGYCKACHVKEIA